MASLESAPRQSRQLHTVLSSIGGFSQPTNKQIHTLEDLLRYVQTLGLQMYSGLEKYNYLGEGVSYKVQKCIDRETGMAVAVKKIKLPPSSSNSEAFEHRVSCVLRDIEVMHHGPLAQHDNILRLWGYGWDNEQGDTIPYLVTELAQKGTLREFLRNSHVPIIDRLGLCGQIIAGLYEMHLCGVAHGDLKLDNVLAVESGPGSPITAKISDFGHSIMLSSDQASVKAYRGTVGYNPPEVYKPESETYVIDVRKCDLWTLGLACWETLANGRPYYEDTSVQEAMSIFTSLASESNVSGTTLGSVESSGIESKLKKIYQIGSQLSSIGLKFVNEVLCHELYSHHRHMCLQLFGDLLNEDPKKRLAKSIHLPLFNSYRASIPKTTVPRKQLVQRTTSEVHWAFETFKPSQMAGTPTSAKVKIFQDFQTMTSHKDPVQAARATLHVAFSYAVGLGVKQNLLNFKTLVQKSADEGLPIAKAMCNLTSNPHWLGENDFKDYYASFIQKTLREFIVKPRLESTTEVSYETLEAASYNAAQATGSSPIPPPILAVFFNLTQEIPLTARINDKDPTTGETALATACKLGDYDAAQNLLNHGADPSIQANDGCLPLHWLFMFEREVELLAANLTQEWFSQHIDCKTFSPRILDAQFPLILHGTPLAFAVTACSEVAVQALLIQGADPTSGFEKRDPDWGDWSPLTIAACLHLDSIFNILWEATVRLHKRNLPHVTTLLSFTQAMSRTSTVERLLIHGQRYQAATVNTAKSLRVVKQNIEPGPDIDVWVPLEAAVHVMDRAVAKALVHVYFRYHQDARDQLFRICLELACRGTLDWSETLSILDFALAQECDINAVFRNGRAIDIVIAHQNEKVLRWLLKRRPYLNELQNAPSNLSFTPLYSMIENGFSKKVPIEVLLVGGADPNCLSPAGNELALHLAIRCEMLKDVELLLAHQANPLIMNSEGITGFFAAINSRNIQLVQLMLPSIRDINVLDLGKTSALSLAVGLDLPNIVTLLLQNGATSESSDPTAIHTAASSGNLKSLEVLIKAGVDVNPEDKAESGDPDGRTPLHLAIRSSSRTPNNAYQCTMALLAAGADPNTENRGRESSQTGNGDQVGDRVQTESRPAHLIFRHFQGQQRLNLVTLLHQKGGKLDVLSNRRTTILHLAAYMGDVPLVHYLLQSGMSPALLGNHNQTPLHDCVRSEYALKRGGYPDIFLANVCQIAIMLAEAGARLPFKPYLAQAPRLEDEIKDEVESNSRYNDMPKLAKRVRDGWKKMQEDRAYRKRQEQEAFANKIEGYGVVLFRDKQDLTPLDLTASRYSDDIVLQCLLQIYRSSNESATANQAVQSGNKAWEKFVQSGWETAVRSSNWLAIRKFLTEKVSIDMNLLRWPGGLKLFQWAIERKDKSLLVLFMNELNSELPDHYPWPNIDITDDFGVELNYLWNLCLDSSSDFTNTPQNKGVRSIFGSFPGLSSGQSTIEVRNHIDRYHHKSKIRQYIGTSLLQDIGKFVCSMDLHTAVHYFGAKSIDRFIFLVGKSPFSRAGAEQLTLHSAAPGNTSTPVGLIYDVWSDPNFDQVRLSKLWQIRDSYKEMLAVVKSPAFSVTTVEQGRSIKSSNNHIAWLEGSIAHEDLKSRPFNFETRDDESTERLPLVQIPRNDEAEVTNHVPHLEI